MKRFTIISRRHRRPASMTVTLKFNGFSSTQDGRQRDALTYPMQVAVKPRYRSPATECSTGEIFFNIHRLSTVYTYF